MKIAILFVIGTVLLGGCAGNTHIVDKMRMNDCELREYRETGETIIVRCFSLGN